MENNQDAELRSLRKRIEDVDRRFAELLNERQQLAVAVAERKIESDIPLRNYSVERQVLARFAEICSNLGAEPHWGIDLANFLIGKSLEAQHNLLERRSSGGQFRILVIGGMGKMGHWIAGFLHNQGHDISILDPSTETSGFRRVSSLDEGLEEAQMVILSVPLSLTSQILDQVTDARPDALLFDLCSIKKEITPSLRRAAAAGLKITSLHPLFGPETKTLFGHNIVICRCGSVEADELAHSLFAETAANLITLELEEHDRLMSLTLGLSHAFNFIFAHAVANCGEDVERLFKVASSTFSKQMNTAHEIVMENVDLYYEIQRQCDHETIYAGLAGAVETFGSLIKGARRQQFNTTMLSNRDYFTKYKSERS